MTMQALSGQRVYTDLWDSSVPDNMAHIALSRGADLVVVGPATADFLAKLANGYANDLLSTLCLARECPLLVAPAMNRQMWENPATRRNIALLERDGVAILGPASGAQACGETGMGRMLEPEQLRDEIVAALQPKILAGRKILITAGPTFEPIDPVRAITNRSSGKMGYAIARAALDAGAKVTLVSGPTSLEPPVTAHVERAVTANDMFEAVKRHAGAADIFIGVAAVADYRAEAVSDEKIKRSDNKMELRLVPNPDILAWVAALPKPPFCVGFAAESHKLNEHADAKRRRKKVQMMVANLAQEAIGADENEVTVLDDSGIHRWPRAAKSVVARDLVAYIAEAFARHGQPASG
jgi:phosphopantothenoylcysteine decarboxylase/phosphopantothenate--cysteine ligase